MKVGIIIIALAVISLSCGKKGKNHEGANEKKTGEVGQRDPDKINQDESKRNDSYSTSLFVCDDAGFGWTNCRLTTTKVASEEGIHAIFRVTYDSSCTVGGSVWQSKLKFRVDQSYSEYIIYGQSGALVVEGSGDLEIVDSDPDQTSKEYFDIEKPCGLGISSVQISPSSSQLKIFEEEEKSFADKVDEYNKNYVLSKNDLLEEGKSLVEKFKRWELSELATKVETKLGEI